MSPCFYPRDAQVLRSGDQDGYGLLHLPGGPRFTGLPDLGTICRLLSRRQFFFYRPALPSLR